MCVAGRTTNATGIATAGAFQTTFGGGTYDAFLASFDADGNLLWATYFGGSGDDMAYSVAVGNYGDIFVTGQTNSTDFPTLNPGSPYYFQGVLGGGNDAFILHFTEAGVLVSATYYGGSGDDIGRGIVVNTDMNAYQMDDVYVTGQTSSTDFPTINLYSGYFQGSLAGGSDAFILHFTSYPGGSLLWATYYGGAGDDIGYGIATAPTYSNNPGYVHVTGQTNSTDFPVFGSLVGGTDAFILSFDDSQNRAFAIYYGGSGNDVGYSIVQTLTGAVYVSGQTSSADFPLKSSPGGGYFQSTLSGTDDAFIAKFAWNGAWWWSTYYGGTGSDVAYSIAIDDRIVYMTGKTNSADFPSQNSGSYYQGNLAGADDAFIVKFDALDNRSWATYYGGTGTDMGYSVSINGNEDVFVTGETSSSDFPTKNSGTYYQPGLAGINDAFFSKFSTCTSTLYAAATSTNILCSGQCSGTATTDTSSGGIAPPYIYLWSAGGQTTPTATGLCAGNYTLTITDGNNCTSSATVTITQSPAFSASFTLVQDSVNPLLWYATTTITGGTPPLSYLWDFGDGNTSTLQYPSHTYAAPGHYPICLTVTDANGCTATTCDSTYKVMAPGIIQYLSVVDPLITGITANQLETNISISPNPSNGKFTLQAGSLFTKYDLEIYNIMGEKVYSSHTPPLSITNRKFEIDLSKQSKGIYLLKIIFDKGVVKKKIIIQ